jgi:hypothetical protein
MNPQGNTHLGVAETNNVKRRDNTGRIIDALWRKKWGILQANKITELRGLLLEDISAYTGLTEHNLVRNLPKYIRNLEGLGFVTTIQISTHMGLLDFYCPTEELLNLSLNEAKHKWWDKLNEKI